jgi:hypothetical protein
MKEAPRLIQRLTVRARLPPPVSHLMSEMGGQN